MRWLVALLAGCGAEHAPVAPARVPLEPIAIPSDVAQPGALPLRVIASELSLMPPSWAPRMPARYTVTGAFASLTSVEDEIASLERTTWSPYRRRVSAPQVTFGVPSATPSVPGLGLDKAIVRRYVRRNVSKLLYCYERRLLALPFLAGTVTARFRILLDGTVVAAEASGVEVEVATCVRNVLGAIEFPKPRGAEVEVMQTMTFIPASSSMPP